MLVLAAPRPESQELVPEKDVTFTESFFESSYAEILLDTLNDPNPQVPLAALSARARHREKVRTRISVLLLLNQD